MDILRILNNNAVVSANTDGEEVVVMGSGIAFKKKSGDVIPKERIERVFYLKKTENKSKFYELISDLPIEYIRVSEKIVKLAEERLKKKLNESIYLLLTDHIRYAVERSRDGIYVRNKLIWEIEHFYPEEYKIGLESVTIINEELKCNLIHAEAGFIAMHIVNSSGSENMADFKSELEDLKVITNIVKFHYNIKINEDSMTYLRFITHLKFFLQRVKSGQSLKKIDQSDELFTVVCKKYFNAYLCVEKIEKYFISTYDTEISDEEKMYLVLHIERVISNT